MMVTISIYREACIFYLVLVLYIKRSLPESLQTIKELPTETPVLVDFLTPETTNSATSAGKTGSAKLKQNHKPLCRSKPKTNKT